MPSMRHILPLDRWHVIVLTATLLLLSGVVYLDLITNWTVLLFYLVPQIAIAWLARGYWWVFMAVLESALWYAVRYFAPPPDAVPNGVHETFDVALVNTLTRLGVLLVIGFLCARLRQFSKSPNALSSSHDATGLLSASGLREAVRRRHTLDLARQGPVAMLLLDGERKISAYGGHSTEHAALAGAVIGKTLLSHARAADLCVRLSPNHFLVIMLNTGQSAAATLNAAVLDALPEITRSLDDSVSVSSLMVFCPTPGPDLDKMRAHTENRLVTLKVMGLGRHHTEAWSPTS